MGVQMDEDARLLAVERAYDTYRDDVFRVAFAILRDQDDAAEATQDVFVRAFEAWERYDPRRPLRPWLHAIASRIALDQLRRKRVRRIAIPGLSERPAGMPGDPFAGTDPASNAGPRHTVEEVLASLQPIARAAVLLRHRYGYDYDEIGAFLGISSSNVGAILTRARAALRPRFHDETLNSSDEEKEA